MSQYRRAVVWGSCVAALLAVAGCSVDLVGPGSGTGTTRTVEVEIGDLVQRIEFSTARPTRGRPLAIKATVINRGAPRPVTTRTCGLDVEGLELEIGPTCAAHSAKTTLARMDSVVTIHSGTVKDVAGSGQVRVRHLLDPEKWVTVDLRDLEE